jgi:hypothetical protein
MVTASLDELCPLFLRNFSSLRRTDQCRKFGVGDVLDDCIFKAIKGNRICVQKVAAGLPCSVNLALAENKL